jgi:hypothetical protein
MHEADGIMGNMRALGISLIAAGLALVCGGAHLAASGIADRGGRRNGIVERGKDGDGRDGRLAAAP